MILASLLLILFDVRCFCFLQLSGDQIEGRTTYGPHTPLPSTKPCHVFSPSFVCGQTLVKRLSLIRGEKMQKQRKRVNETSNNSLVIKESKRVFSSFSRDIDNIRAISHELTYRYWNLPQMEKLSTWWPDCSQDRSCHNSRMGLKQMEQTKPGRFWLYLKQSRWSSQTTTRPR